MLEDIVLDKFPKEAGAYLFKVNEEVIYVGSSKNIYMRMAHHRSNIKKGSNHGSQQDIYQFLQSNHFAVEFQTTDNYKQLEQKLIEQYHPKYNSHRANTGLGAHKGREAEYKKEYNEKYQDEMKQYRESHKEEKKQYNKQYLNQLCYYNDETLTLDALRKRFSKAGIPHPTIEAKKYLIKEESKTPIEFYDVYP